MRRMSALTASLIFCAVASSTFQIIAAPPNPPREPAKAKSDSFKPETKFDLKYKFKAGETVRVEVVHRATVETSIQGVSQTAKTKSTSTKVWKITDVTPAGQITFIHSVESIDMWQQTQGRQEVRYNSQTDQQPPPGYEEVSQAVGVPLTVVTMDARGKVLNRFEKRAVPSSSPSPITAPLPSEPVSVGHVWSSPLELEVLPKGGAVRKVQARQQFTLAQVIDGVATIELETQVLTPVNDPVIEAQLIQRLPSGTMEFDIAAGRVTAQEMDLNRRVIGFSGAASTMHYETRFTEKLLPAAAETARVPERPASAKPAVAPPALNVTPAKPAGKSSRAAR